MVKRFTPFLFLVFLSACNFSNPTTPNHQGTWRSITSGQILDIDGENCKWYDFTAATCFPVSYSKLAELKKGFHIESDTLWLKYGVASYGFTRIASVPERCQIPIPKTKAEDPIFNFEVFSKTLEENYAFFELNNLDWKGIYEEQKSKLVQDPSDINLLLIIEETFEKINDNHGFIEASDQVYDQLEKMEAEEEINEEEDLPSYGDFVIADLVTDHYLKEEMTKETRLMRWGKLSDQIAYLQIKSMWLYADLNLNDSLVKQNGYVDTYVDAFHKMEDHVYIEMERKRVEELMEKVLEDIRSFPTLIVDVRFNGGGQDVVSFEILKHLNPFGKIVMNQKQQFRGSFSPIMYLSLPNNSTAYSGNVFVLTSPQTGSAAESFALASFSLDQFKNIGSATSGALSTALEKKLPNGWDFALSNEISSNATGKIFENSGVPVDYELNYPKDRQSFFRYVADNLEEDKQKILKGINSFSQN